MKFLAKLEKQKATWFLIIAAFLFFLFRLPSLFEPYWYGDEGIYEVIGTALRQGRHLYSGIWDNKPPLLYYIYAMFNGNQTSVRLLSLLFGLASVFTFFYLSKKLFQNQHIQFLVTSIFAFLFATPFLEGNIANAENFMILPILLAALLIFKTEEQSIHSKKHVTFPHNDVLMFLAGLLLGIAFLIKIVAILDFGAFLVFVFIKNYKNVISISKQLKNLLIFTFGFIVPILMAFLFFLTQGNLKMFITSAFLSNAAYVEYGNNFFIPHGWLLTKLFVLCLFVIFLFFKRKTISSVHLFILLWIGFSLFDVFFSQRPYTHYILTFIASFSLYTGLCITNKKLQRIFIPFLLILIIVVGGYFSLQKRVYKFIFGYYGNFLSFSIQQKGVQEYFSFFDGATPYDYAIASFINLNKKNTDEIFIWGNDAQIYKLTHTLPPGRFLVTYHMTLSADNWQETRSAITSVSPKYIIILPKQSVIPYSMVQYQPKINIGNTIIYEKVL